MVIPLPAVIRSSPPYSMAVLVALPMMRKPGSVLQTPANAVRRSPTRLISCRATPPWKKISDKPIKTNIHAMFTGLKPSLSVAKKGNGKLDRRKRAPVHEVYQVGASDARQVNTLKLDERVEAALGRVLTRFSGGKLSERRKMTSNQFTPAMARAMMPGLKRGECQPGARPCLARPAANRRQTRRWPGLG
ncbi:MAG: hypothetical protein Ct9H300mP32_2100 [Verrucomicrobiota bacterium]|nr:MAG: hypothetical protein Ct9H300mP32_2100 [Verrucomicrobiota bacterium]